MFVLLLYTFVNVAYVGVDEKLRLEGSGSGGGGGGLYILCSMSFDNGDELVGGL